MRWYIMNRNRSDVMDIDGTFEKDFQTSINFNSSYKYLKLLYYTEASEDEVGTYSNVWTIFAQKLRCRC